MSIDYRLDQEITATEFVDLLHRSTLAERRPIEDMACMDGMVNNSNVLISAWNGGVLVGIARSLTDFHYACYLSDLAVDKEYQKHGIGKQLMQLTQEQLGDKCKLILLAAPDANDYYPRVGFSHNPRCWMLEPGDAIT